MDLTLISRKESPSPPFSRRLSTLAPEQELYLTSPATLDSWVSFTLAQRVHLANIRFPFGPKTTSTSLRELYARHNIKPRKLLFTPLISPKKESTIDMEKLERLPRLLMLVAQRKCVLFLDECVFTNRSIADKVWAKPNSSAIIA